MQDQHNITLFIVDNGVDLDTSEIFKKSIEILTDHKISQEKIRTHMNRGINVAGTIMSYAENNRFAAIAVGLHGVNKGFLKSLNLAGGTTASLIERAEKVSLWSCP